MRNRKDNYSDIYDALRTPQGEKLPDALQPEAIEALVKDKTMRPKQKRTGKIVAAAAGFIVLLLTGIFAARFLYSPSVVETPLDSGASAAQNSGDAYLQNIEDYTEIEDYFLELQKGTLTDRLQSAVQKVFNGLGGQKTNEALAEGAVGYDMAGSATGSQDLAAYGTTNTQVQNVDESDILKNDGEYLYIARNTNDDSDAYVEIVDIRTPTALKQAAHISVRDDTHKNRCVQELYVRGNTLIVLCGDYTDYASAGTDMLIDDAVGGYANVAKTVALVYDITDRSAPALRYSYGVDGGTVSTRMTGDTLLLVTQYSVPMYENKTDLKNACVPCYYNGEEKYRFPASGIYRAADSTDSTYMTVSLLDTAASSPAQKTVAVLGGGTEIYCSENALLIAGMDYSNAVSTSPDGETTSFTPALASTRLYAFQIEGELAYLGSAGIDGTLLNQFSMDEQDGYYRIATTAQDGCIVTVLDKALKTVGQLRSIAPGESIYAARFIGDTAYLVTFYQTDPLFVIDLSDPKQPQIAGKLKIPGFSNYLHPYSDTLLIGIGQAGTDSGAIPQLKISVFDVSDPKNPKEASNLIFGKSGYSYSASQYEHKAYLAFSDGSFAVPVTENPPQGGSVTYLCRMTVQNDGTLQILNRYTLPNAQEELLRATYAGDTVFTLSQSQLVAYSKTDASVLSVLSLT